MVGNQHVFDAVSHHNFRFAHLLATNTDRAAFDLLMGDPRALVGFRMRAQRDAKGWQPARLTLPKAHADADCHSELYSLLTFVRGVQRRFLKTT